MIKCSESTVRRYIAAGYIRSMSRSRRVYADASDVAKVASGDFGAPQPALTLVSVPAPVPVAEQLRDLLVRLLALLDKGV